MSVAKCVVAKRGIAPKLFWKIVPNPSYHLFGMHIIPGMQSTIHHLPEDTSQSSLLSLVYQLNLDPDIDGILVQLPLPSYLEEKIVCNAVAPEKDVDGFHITNIG
ncbi:Bifunctional protein FolD 1, mitochondrial, partial [Halocaridina rubra]